MITVRFEGGAELLRALNQLPERVSARFVREALTHAAEPMRKSMAQKAPRGEGSVHLRDEILIRNARGTDRKEVAVAVGPSTQVFYGSFQELGTAFHPAQPFARPAFDETVQGVLKRFADDVWVSLASRKISRPTAIADVPIESGSDVL